ncbi:MAG: hypothetical protein IPM04_12980 [Saprospiraceae bacterium]|nr:hypothetical protein [Candidatus Brachybacter algidus]
MLKWSHRPVAGDVVEINKEVVQQPALVNESPLKKDGC